MSPFHHPVHKMDTEIDAGRNISHTGGDRRGKSNGAVKFRNSEVFIGLDILSLSSFRNLYNMMNITHVTGRIKALTPTNLRTNKSARKRKLDEVWIEL